METNWRGGWGWIQMLAEAGEDEYKLCGDVGMGLKSSPHADF